MCEKKEKTDCTMTDTAFAEHIVARIFSILKEYFQIYISAKIAFRVHKLKLQQQIETFRYYRVS